MYPALPLFSDRTKRRAILWPTRPLPAAQRVPLRHALLRRLEIGKARRAPMIVVAHQKSGNTWLRTMISRYFQVKYDLPSDLIAKSDELHRRQPDIPSVFCTNGYYSYQSIIAESLDEDHGDPEIRQKPVLFISRHPADLAVSWYFQFTKRESEAKVELINTELGRPIDRRSVSLQDFIFHSELGLSFMIEYLNAWKARVERLPEGHLTSYEAMRADPAVTLVRVLNFLGETCFEPAIDEAIRFTSFDNLKRLEVSGHFTRGGISRQQEDDPNARKVRRGKIGGYRDYFTPEQLLRMDEMVNQKLDPELGYGRDGLSPAGDSDVVRIDDFQKRRRGAGTN
jgi:hypothetical protein